MDKEEPSLLHKLILVQFLYRDGINEKSWSKITDLMHNHPLIKETKKYNTEEYKKIYNNLLSKNGLIYEQSKPYNPPNSIPSQSVVILSTILYKNYKDLLYEEILHDELLFKQYLREIDEINRGEWDERLLKKVITDKTEDSNVDPNTNQPTIEIKNEKIITNENINTNNTLQKQSDVVSTIKFQKESTPVSNDNIQQKSRTVSPQHSKNISSPIKNMAKRTSSEAGLPSPSNKKDRRLSSSTGNKKTEKEIQLKHHVELQIQKPEILPNVQPESKIEIGKKSIPEKKLETVPNPKKNVQQEEQKLEKSENQNSIPSTQETQNIQPKTQNASPAHQKTEKNKHIEKLPALNSEIQKTQKELEKELTPQKATESNLKTKSKSSEVHSENIPKNLEESESKETKSNGEEVHQSLNNAETSIQSVENSEISIESETPMENHLQSTKPDEYEETTKDSKTNDKKETSKTDSRKSNERVKRETNKSSNTEIDAEEKKKLTVRIRKFQSVVAPLFTNITSLRAASYFSNPISDSEAPNYSQLVYVPTDLRTIKQQMKDGRISNFDELERELIRMLANAFMYNRSDSDMTTWTRELYSEIEGLISAFKNAS